MRTAITGFLGVFLVTGAIGVLIAWQERRAFYRDPDISAVLEAVPEAGDRLRQAQQSYNDAFSQLSTGTGNLLRQTDMLRELGARNTKQLDQKLAEQAKEESPALIIVQGETIQDEAVQTGTDKARGKESDSAKK